MKFFIPIFLITLWSCGTNNTKTPNHNKPLIVTTTGIIQNSVKELVNKNIEVVHIDIISLLGPNSDPHLAKASKSDLKKLNDADIIISNGLHLEGKLADALEKFGKKKVYIKISDGIPDSLLLDANGVHDPHIWFDVFTWRTGMQYVYNQLTQIDYTKNKISPDYLSQLDNLHNEIKSKLDQYPVENRTLITAHDAFRYFGKAYNVEVIGIQGISTLSQTSIKRRQELSDLIIEKNIKLIFPETSVRDNQVKAIIEDCEAKNHEVRIGKKLYSDALGAEDSPADTYIKMVRYNVQEIVKSFQ